MTVTTNYEFSNQCDMTTIYSSIDKTLIPEMPQVLFDGTVTVVDTLETAEQAVKYLRTQKIIGFDTETKPSFKKGVVNKPALLQLASHDRAFLFRMNIIGLPDFVCSLLSDPTVKKIGLSVKDDFGSLRRRCPVEPAAFVELQDYAAQIGIEEKGLQRMFALLFGKRISKNQQLSNWENETLTEGQCLYAATDAWACIVIYEYLHSLRRSGDYQIIRRNAEESIAEEG